MASIKFQIDATSDPPKVITNGVASLYPEDKLLFEGDQDILLDLGGGEATATIIGLVRQKLPAVFATEKLDDGRVVVKLARPTAGGPLDSGPDIWP